MPGTARPPKKTGVLFIYTPAFFGSVWTVCSHIINGLDPERFDVHVAYNASAEGSIQVAARPGLTLVPWSFGAAPAGATSRPGAGGGGRLAVARGAAASVFALAAYIRRHDVRVVHCNEDGHSAVLGAAVTRLTRARLVLHYHTVPSLYGRGRRTLMAVLARAAAWNVGVSAFVARALIAAGGPPARTGFVLNGVDSEKFNPGVDGRAIRREYGVDDGDLLVVQSARIWQGKRQEDLVRAMVVARQHTPNLKCLIIGWEDPRYDGPYASYLDELRALAAELGVEGSVIFAKPRPEAAQIHAAADLSVLSSVDDPCPLVVTEAMATGRPMVGADSGGIPEMIEDGVTGFLVPPNDPGALAEKIGLLAADSALRERLGRAARARVLVDFAERRVAASFDQIYGAVARAARPPAPLTGA